MPISQKIHFVSDVSQKYKDDVQQARRDLFNDSKKEPLLLSQETDDTILRIKNISERISGEFKNLIIIAVGASINIPKMLWSFSDFKELNVFFIERVDSIELDNIFRKLDTKETCILTISKSGNTVEVNFLLSKFIQWLKKSLSSAQLKTHLYFITEVDSKLYKFAESINASSVPHPSNVGGRFSAFNTTGLLPASIFGLNLEALISSGKDSFTKLISEDSWVIDGVLYNYVMFEKFTQAVLIKYDTVFDGALCWVRQLIAESLGKNSHGFTPIVSDGLIDRHSQLQLYLDGPDDKFFTFFSYDKNEPRFEWERSSDAFTDSIVSSKINSFSFRQFNNEQERALFKTLSNAEKNIRKFTITSSSEDIISEFMMGQMLEIMLYAYLKAINPFGQPAIESFKKELRFME